MHNFRELDIWKESRKLVKDIYEVMSEFPNQEKFNLISQVQRSAISIPSNIAEGSGRGNKEFMHFLSIALSSAFELETQLYLAFDLGYITENKLEELRSIIQVIQKKIYKFRLTLEPRQVFNP